MKSIIYLFNSVQKCRNQKIITQSLLVSSFSSEVELVTKDVLGMMMVARDEETGQGMTDQELQDQVVTLMFTGHEVIYGINTAFISIL